MNETPVPYDPGPDRRTPVERLIDEVFAAIAERRLEDARTMAGRAIETEPVHAPAWVAAGAAHRALEENDRALSFFHEAVRLDHTLAQGWCGLADTYADLGQDQMAVEAAREAAAAAPEDASLRARHAKALANADRLAEAQRELEEALRLSPGNRWFERELARILCLTGHYAEAILILETLRKRSKMDAGFWGKDLAIAYLLTGDHRPAERVLGKIHAVSPVSLEFRILFYSFLKRHANGVEGEAKLRGFLDDAELEPRVAAAAWYELGQSLRSRGEVEDSIAALETADRLQPDWTEGFAVDYRLALGEAYSARGRSGEAVAAFRSALEIAPESARAWALLGTELGTVGQYDEAIEAMRKVPQLDPGIPEIWFSIGGLCQRAGKLMESVEAYREGARRIEDAVERSRCWNNMGATLLELGREDEAFEAYEFAVAANPGNGRAWANLGRFHGDRGRGPRAMVCLENAVRLRPYAFDYAYYLGIAYAMCRRGDRVAEMAARLKNVAPAWSKQLETYAAALEGTGPAQGTPREAPK